jgi:hypothetical protein
MKYEEIDAVNWSTLVHMATSAKLLAWRKDHPREETPALRRGTAIHRALLEPERFVREYVAEPDFGDGRTKAAKEAKAVWSATVAPGAVILDADEHELVVRCAEAARAHPAVRDLLRGGHAEEVLTWHDEMGIACKGRVDYLTPAYLLDLKSTRAETLPQLAREIAGRLYHGQIAFYLDGAIAAKRVDALASAVYVVAVQTVEPYDVIPARIMPEDIERGRSLYRSLLRRYAECQAAGYWPGLAPQIVDLSLPEWAPGGELEPEQEAW